MRVLIVLGVLGVLIGLSPEACSAQEVPDNERVWSYTVEQIYERAEAYKRLSQGKAPKEPTALGDTIMKAGEFRGFIAYALDEANVHKEYNDCARRLSLSDIAGRAAVVLTGIPMDRANNAGMFAAMTVAVAIGYGCDDASFKKPK